MKRIIFYSLLLFTPYLSSKPKAICIDVEVLFETSKMRAKNYVGAINALKYLKQVGHLPNQEDLFKQLTPVPAISTQLTYNDNLNMPLIFSDWLINLQTPSSLIKAIDTYLQKSKLSAIEKTIFNNTAHMMLTPEELIDTQQVITSSQKLIEELAQKHYQVYIVGNWADTASLQHTFKKALQKCNGLLLSGTLHFLKPYPEFYQAVLETTQLKLEEVVWIEKEPKFIKQAQSYGLQVAIFNPQKPKELVEQLKQFKLL